MHNTLMKNLDKLAPFTLFLVRIVAGLLIMQHGGNKIFGWFGGIPEELGGHPEFLSQSWIGGVFEFYGGLLILLGLFTRFAAFILSGQMAVAYFQFHQPNGTWPIENGGVPAVLYCFIFLYLTVKGGGTWSLGAMLSKHRNGA